MKKPFGRIGLFCGLAVLASAAPAFAQPVDRFHRVTSTTGRDPRGLSPATAGPSPRATCGRIPPPAGWP